MIGNHHLQNRGPGNRHQPGVGTEMCKQGMCHWHGKCHWLATECLHPDSACYIMCVVMPVCMRLSLCNGACRCPHICLPGPVVSCTRRHDDEPVVTRFGGAQTSGRRSHCHLMMAWASLHCVLPETMLRSIVLHCALPDFAPQRSAPTKSRAW